MSHRAVPAATNPLKNCRDAHLLSAFGLRDRCEQGRLVLLAEFETLIAFVGDDSDLRAHGAARHRRTPILPLCALPAVMNAVIDALASVGVRQLDMPATPERVWQAIQDVKKR